MLGFWFSPARVGWIELIQLLVTKKTSQEHIWNNLTSEKRIGRTMSNSLWPRVLISRPLMAPPKFWMIIQEPWWIITPWVVTKLAWDICWPNLNHWPDFPTKNMKHDWNQHRDYIYIYRSYLLSKWGHENDGQKIILGRDIPPMSQSLRWA